jgi:hypothetical protein
MADPAYMSHILHWMVPRTLEEKIFKRYVDMVLENHKTCDAEAIFG